MVSTGANLYHDLHECRGRHHFIGSPQGDDVALQTAHIDRVYDTLVDEDEFIENDEWIADFTRTLHPRPYTSREFLYLLGEHLWNETGEDGNPHRSLSGKCSNFLPGHSGLVYRNGNIASQT